MVYIFLAEGFEEIEGLTVVDLMRRAGIDICMTGLEGKDTVCGAHGIRIGLDGDITSVKMEQAEMLVLPGGMPGTKYLAQNENLAELLREADARELPIAAICAAPSVLGGLGLLKGRRAVCYPGFEEQLDGAEVGTEAVCRDGHIVTSRGMGTAIEFAGTLIAMLKGKAEAERILTSIIYQ